MIIDPWFYVAAFVGTFLIGMSKSGFLPGIGALGVPLMALTVLPMQACGSRRSFLPRTISCIAVPWVTADSLDRAALYRGAAMTAVFVGRVAAGREASVPCGLSGFANNSARPLPDIKPVR